MNDIHICFATDENYAPYCGVAILSAIANKAQNDRLHIYILNRSLGVESKKKLVALSEIGVCEVQIVDISSEIFRDAPIADGFHFMVETYLRLLIPQVFSHLDKMLYLDCDILVRRSLADLFFTDTLGCLLGMARNKDVRRCEGNYNAGVMLIDCKKWRESGITNKLTNFIGANKNDINHDQHLISLTLHNEIYEIDQKWNREIYLDFPGGDKIEQDDVILHYLSHAKPWHGVYQNALVDEYFGYLTRLPWDIEDHRERNKDINPARYYNGRLALLYLMAKKMISKEGVLTLILALGSKGELAYVARDLDFKHIEETELQDIPVCGCEDTRIIVENDFDYEIKDTLERLGYQNAVHYSFLRTMMTGQIEKTLDKVIKPHRDKTGRKPEVIIYGTANWALKCTEIAVRNNMHVICYVDSAPEKWDTVFCRKKIISPMQVKEVVGENTLILIASSAIDQIENTLFGIGIDKEQITTFDVMRKMEQ